MKLLYFIGILLWGVSFSCKKPLGYEDCENGCKPNRVCTEEFRSLIVQVSNNSNTDVALDSFVVVRLKDSEVIINNDKAITQGVPGGTGRYLLFSDSDMDETSRCGEAFEFRGYINKKLVANREYAIAHDCCHITLISGDTKIVVGQ